MSLLYVAISHNMRTCTLEEYGNGVHINIFMGCMLHLLLILIWQCSCIKRIEIFWKNDKSKFTIALEVNPIPNSIVFVWIRWCSCIMIRPFPPIVMGLFTTLMVGNASMWYSPHIALLSVWVQSIWPIWMTLYHPREREREGGGRIIPYKMKYWWGIYIGKWDTKCP